MASIDDSKAKTSEMANDVIVCLNLAQQNKP